MLTKRQGELKQSALDCGLYLYFHHEAHTRRIIRAMLYTPDGHLVWATQRMITNRKYNKPEPAARLYGRIDGYIHSLNKIETDISADCASGKVLT